MMKGSYDSTGLDRRVAISIPAWMVDHRQSSQRDPYDLESLSTHAPTLNRFCLPCLLHLALHCLLPLKFPILHNIAIITCGEHNQPDPGLIIEGPRQPLPLKRVQGCDYPITLLEEIHVYKKGKLILLQQNVILIEPGPQSQSQISSKCISY
jgi:hypothetical protein